MLFSRKWIYLFGVFTFISCSSSKSEKTISHINEDVVTIAILGDQGTGIHAQNILSLVKSQGADLLLINGDFDYEDEPKKWEKMHLDILGRDFPIIAVAGNHDVPKWSEYQKIISRWEQNPKLTCTGEAGVMTDCMFEGIEIVSVTPDIFENQKPNISQTYIKETFEKSNAIWRISQWHKAMRDMQTGDKGDSTGWGVYEESRKQGAMIVTGHEHAYSRSYLLSDFPNKIVDSNSSTMQLEKGKTFMALSGLGGRSSRPKRHEGYWWAAEENADTGAEAGVLFCTYRVDNNPKKASCYFMDEYKKVLDTFTLINNLK